jgi:hypothetical protein
MRKIKSWAVLIRYGRPIGIALTAATNGSIVSYGAALVDPVTEMPGGIHEVGRAKISRVKKLLNDGFLFDSLPVYDVNDGGGLPY